MSAQTDAKPSPGDDIRLDPRLRAYYKSMPPQPPPALTRAQPREVFHAMHKKLDAAVFPAMALKLFPAGGKHEYGDLRYSQISVPTSDADGRTVLLHVFKPAAVGRYPCVVHIHSGGMTFWKALDECPESFAHAGAVCVSIDFRNSYVKPFPGGLTDCLDGVNYILAHQDELEITPQIVLTGGSGGGNLAIATSKMSF